MTVTAPPGALRPALYRRPVDDHEDEVDASVDEVTLLRNAGVRITLEGQELVAFLNRPEGDYIGRRRALASARNISRLSAQLVDALSEGGRDRP
jgi:hypothetical protein